MGRCSCQRAHGMAGALNPVWKEAGKEDGRHNDGCVREEFRLHLQSKGSLWEKDFHKGFDDQIWILEIL